jgi:hypothetical protein
MSANDTLSGRWKEVRMLRRTIAAALLAAAPLVAEDGQFEKTIPFPRDRPAELDWTSRKCVIRSVTVRNYPDGEDIEKARASDPKDSSWLWWVFDVDNRGPEKLKIKLFVEVLDETGKIIKSGDRSVTIDGFESDEYLVSTRMRTIDAADAPRVRIRAQIVPK